jgi:hypothetical protein
MDLEHPISYCPNLGWTKLGYPIVMVSSINEESLQSLSHKQNQL